MDIDARVLMITPGNLTFGKLLLHWLIANKSRKTQNALSHTSGPGITSDLSGLSGTCSAI